MIHFNKNNDSILIVYGWGTPNSYFNYQIKPHNKYWIIHPNILSENQRKEWTSLFYTKPPTFINYNAGDGANMNTEEFEKKYLPLEKLLKNVIQGLKIFTRLIQEITS